MDRAGVPRLVFPVRQWLTVVFVVAQVDRALADPRLMISEQPLNLDADRYFETLEVRCDVVLDTVGRYVLLVTLDDRTPFHGEPDRRWAVGVQTVPRPYTSRIADGEDDVFLVTTDSSGRASVSAHFRCEHLYRLDADGPWELTVRAIRYTVDDPFLMLAIHPDAFSIFMHADTWAWKRSQFDSFYRGELEPLDADARTGKELALGLDWELFVATVLGSTPAGTQADPPTVAVRVDEVLRGRRADEVHTVHWGPRPLMNRCGVGIDELLARWNPIVIPAPAVGSRWILAVYRPKWSLVWRSLPECRWSYSDSLRLHLIEECRLWPGRRHRLQQLRAEARREEARWYRGLGRVEAK